MRKPTVLIADGLRLIREGTREILERSNRFTVVGEAGDGEEAVRMTVESNPDVVLLDIALPRLNGLEATRQIKGSCPRTAVVVLVENEDDVYVRALVEVGAAGYVNRTARGRDLVQRILDQIRALPKPGKEPGTHEYLSVKPHTVNELHFRASRQPCSSTL